MKISQGEVCAPCQVLAIEKPEKKKKKNDKTPAPEVFCSCSFVPRAHFETSLVMASYYVYEI